MNQGSDDYDNATNKHASSATSTSTSNRRRPFEDNEREAIVRGFQHFKEHMKIDFLYHNNFLFNQDYLDTLCAEWLRVANLPPRQLEDATAHNTTIAEQTGGFITFRDYGALARRMRDVHGIDSWQLNEEEWNGVLREEFTYSECMSLRRFCLYAEREELYNDQEEAIRLVQPENYYALTPFGTPTTGRKCAYMGDYGPYRLCCKKQLRLDLVLRRRSQGEDDDLEGLGRDQAVLDGYVDAFEKEDPNQTGCVDRDALLRVLYELASGADSGNHRYPFQQSALRLLQYAALRRTGNGSSSFCINQSSNVNELDAQFRIDSEFAVSRGHEEVKALSLLSRPTTMLCAVDMHLNM